MIENILVCHNDKYYRAQMDSETGLLTDPDIYTEANEVTMHDFMQYLEQMSKEASKTK